MLPQQRKQRFSYCPKCGGNLRYRFYEERPRLTCSSCSYVLYENPIVGVAAIILNENKQILLGRRKNGKYSGLWCIPCGYVEYDEDVYDAVKREINEETGLDIEITRLFTVQSNFHDPEKHSVGIWFLAHIKNGQPIAGDDLDKVAYFNLDDVPPLAFPTDKTVIDFLRKEIKGRYKNSIHG